MTWLFVIGLAIGAFAMAVVLFRLPKSAWTTVLAALVLGLAGYAFQGSPGMTGAPKVADEETGAALGEELVTLRRQVMAEENWGDRASLITADAMTRRGRFEYAAALIEGHLEKYPRDAEAWLSLANTLVAHADGTITPAASLAYAKVEEIAPGDPAVPFFLGLTELQRLQLLEARSLWAEARERTPEGSEAREAMDVRLSRLDELLRRIVEQRQMQGN